MAASSSMEDVEKFCLRQANVSPHWLSGGDAFWYNRESEISRFEFMLVDCVTGRRRRVFDQEAPRRGASQADVPRDRSRQFALLVDTIPPGMHPGSGFGFQRALGSFCPAGNLERWDGEFDTGSFELEDEEVPPPRDDAAVPSPITFVNNTASIIYYHWINHKGEAIYYGAVQAGQRQTQYSYSGHVWRITIQDSNKKAICAVKEYATVGTITESPIGLHIQLNKDEDEAAVGASAGAGKEDHPTRPKLLIRDFNLWLVKGRMGRKLSCRRTAPRITPTVREQSTSPGMGSLSSPGSGKEKPNPKCTSSRRLRRAGQNQSCQKANFFAPARTGPWTGRGYLTS